ncbi:MAG: M23 family metallopeptidase [Spirochaetia bacterium]|nr:M23 family metallopeptidase [Spirochaetia bacterium]
MRLAALLLLMSVSIYAEDVNEEARPMPAQQVQKPQHAESNEIDQEIKRYFSKIEDSTLDVDQRRLDKIFQSIERPVIPEQESGTFSFNDMGKNNVTHRVQPKETIFAIAKKYGMKPADLVAQNPELKNRPLYIGEDLLIDSSSKAAAVAAVTPMHQIKRGENLSTIARKYKTTVAVIAKLIGISAATTLKEGKSLRVPGPAVLYRAMFAWPVQAPITSYFGRRYNPFIGGFPQFHKGLDLGAYLGTPFHAARDGIVIFSGRMEGYGNCIFVRHAADLVTVYGHNKVNLVKQGDVVRQGQVIGQVGRTGSATGPHLHFEVRKQELALNPLVALGWKEVVQQGQNVAQAR